MSAFPAITAAATRRGILAIIASQACFVFGDAAVKLAAAHLPTGEIIVVRGFFATLVIGAMITASGAAAKARLVFHPLVLLRAGVEAFIITAFISALTLLQLADIVAITQAAPLITALILVAVYGERFGWRRWSAIAAGFIGVLLVVKPGPQGLQPAAALALAVAVGIALRDLITRRIPAVIPSLIITLATTEAAVLAGLGLGLTETWVMPRGVGFLLLIAAAVATTVGNYFVVIAFRGTDAGVVSPFRYIIVIFALLMGYAVWRELPDIPALAGTALIVASGVFMIYRERIRSKRPRVFSADVEP